MGLASTEAVLKEASEGSLASPLSGHWPLSLLESTPASTFNESYSSSGRHAMSHLNSFDGGQKDQEAKRGSQPGPKTSPSYWVYNNSIVESPWTLQAGAVLCR